jgi:hypothetical protein
MIRTLLTALLAGACLISTAAQAAKPAPSGAAYIRLDAGWQGYFPHQAEYVQYTLDGDAQPQDAFHVMLKPGMGMMITFADKKQFSAGKNLLEAHREWELGYWRKQVNKLESKNRDDLAGGQSGLMVTEIDMQQPNGPGMRVYMIGAESNDGVFVFSLSPVEAADDAMVKKLISSIKVEHKPLDLKAEAKKIAPAAQPGTDKKM